MSRAGCSQPEDLSQGGKEAWEEMGARIQVWEQISGCTVVCVGSDYVAMPLRLLFSQMLKPVTGN